MIHKGGQGSAPPFGNQNARKTGAREPRKDSRIDARGVQEWWENFMYESQDNMPEDQKNAIDAYSSGDTLMNSMLRGKFPYDKNGVVGRRIKDSIRSLISAMRPLPADAVLFRGVDKFPYKVGDTFKDSGFVSTSAQHSVGKNWAHTLITIDVPKGAPAAAGNFKEHKDDDLNEEELILPPWSHFRVLSVETRDKVGDKYGTGEVHLQYVPTKRYP